ncbi:MAG: HAMP domain-containing sensor histidine kinase [Bdellovibrionota bacterium]
MNLIARIFIIITSIIVFTASVTALSFNQVVDQLKARTENTLLLWSQPLGEKILKGSGPEVFNDLFNWLKRNEKLVSDITMVTPDEILVLSVKHLSYQQPLIYRGAELFNLRFQLHESELYWAILLSPLFLGAHLLAMAALFIILILRQRHSNERRVMEAEKRWQEEKVRWAKQVAHDLRQPLSFLRVLAENLTSGGIKSEESKLLFQTVDRIEKTAKDLLQIGMKNQNHLGASCINDVLAELVQEYQRTRPEINWVISKSIGTEARNLIPLKKNKIQRILSNILDNAVDVTKPGQSIFLGLTEDEGKIVFECIDEGPGFEENILSQIGKSTVTTKKQGNGLGLYDSSIVLNHLGGKINIDSKQGVGSRVQLHFPELKIEQVLSLHGEA